MITDRPMEDRVAALEKSVADLRQEVQGRTERQNWIRAISGSMTDHEAFDRMLEFGRAWRRGELPEAETGR